jgi:hypothetical protein
VCSTAGTEESVVLNRKVETGREAVAEDSGYGVAYFEWSAPDDWDPGDEDAYFTFSPALCPNPPCRCAPPGEGWKHTITLEALRAERGAMEPPEFKRAYGNVTSGVKDEKWTVVPQADWDAACDPTLTYPESMAFAVTLSTDRQWATISAAGRQPNGLYSIHQIERRQSTGWVVPRLKQLVEKWNPVAVVIYRSSPAESLAADAELEGIELTPITAVEQAAACGAFVDGIAGRPARDPDTGEMGRDPRVLRHRDQPELTAAIAGARTKRMGMSVTWDPLSASVDITPAIGCSNALWGFMTNQVQPREPLVAWG